MGLRKYNMIVMLLIVASVCQIGCGGTGTVVNSDPPAVITVSNLIPSLQSYTTPTGTVSTYSSTGSIDPTGIFFQPLGTNGRTCGSCHQLSQGMSISAASTLALFNSTSGADPLFAAVDGANCPTAPPTTLLDTV